MTTATQSTEHLALTSEADVRSTRAFLRRLTEELPFDRRQIADIILAVSEACMNGVRYGVPDTDSAVTLITRPADDHLAIEVYDSGSGFHLREPEMPDPMAESGRGIALMHALMDRVDIESNQSGTRVRMVKYYDRETL